MPDQEIRKKDKLSTGLTDASFDVEVLRVDTHTHTHTERKAPVYSLCVCSIAM